MGKNEWVRGDLKIRYSHPWITPLYDYRDGEYEVERPVRGISDAMYFYYHIDILDGDKKIFSAGTHDFPKVLDLPLFIDTIVGLDMKKDGHVINELSEYGFHRKIRYAQIILEDPFVDVEYSYKIERYDYAVKQSDDHHHKRWTEYVLTISEMGVNSSHGNAVVIKDVTENELLSLKETAIGFCEYAVSEYNKELSGDKGE